MVNELLVMFILGSPCLFGGFHATIQRKRGPFCGHIVLVSCENGFFLDLFAQRTVIYGALH